MKMILLRKPTLWRFQVPDLAASSRRDRHLQNSLGKDVELKLYKPRDGVKEFAGTLKSFTDSEVTVTINDKDETFIRKRDISY
nr:hypothetical protein [Butyrivibrio sp. FCS014]